MRRDFELDIIADLVFREDAARLGYLPEDPREPGKGRGIQAYYRDHGFHASDWQPNEPILFEREECE